MESLGYKERVMSVRMKNLKGGFSDEVFNHEYLQRYIRVGTNTIVWRQWDLGGYIGHSGRTLRSDQYLEKKFYQYGQLPKLKKEVYNGNFKGDRYLLLAIWLTSTDGRHFCDSIEGESLVERRKMIDHDIKRIYEVATRYFNETCRNSIRDEISYRRIIL